MAWRRHRCGRRRHLAETGAPSHEPDRCPAFQRGRRALLAAECLCGLCEVASASSLFPTLLRAGGGPPRDSAVRWCHPHHESTPRSGGGAIAGVDPPARRGGIFLAHECKTRALHSCAEKWGLLARTKRPAASEGAARQECRISRRPESRARAPPKRRPRACAPERAWRGPPPRHRKDTPLQATRSAPAGRRDSGRARVRAPRWLGGGPRHARWAPHAPYAGATPVR